MIHGTIKWFYENGSLLHTTDYIWGLEHGYVKNYSESGKLLNTPPCIHGVVYAQRELEIPEPLSKKESVLVMLKRNKSL